MADIHADMQTHHADVRIRGRFSPSTSNGSPKVVGNLSAVFSKEPLRRLSRATEADGGNALCCVVEARESGYASKRLSLGFLAKFRN